MIAAHLFLQFAFWNEQQKRYVYMHELSGYIDEGVYAPNNGMLDRSINMVIVSGDVTDLDLIGYSDPDGDPKMVR